MSIRNSSQSATSNFVSNLDSTSPVAANRARGFAVPAAGETPALVNERITLPEIMVEVDGLAPISDDHVLDTKQVLFHFHYYFRKC